MYFNTRMRYNTQVIGFFLNVLRGLILFGFYFLQDDLLLLGKYDFRKKCINMDSLIKIKV